MRSCTAWLWWCQQSCNRSKWMQPADREADSKVFKLFSYCDIGLMPLPWSACWLHQLAICLTTVYIHRRQCNRNLSCAAKLVTDQTCSLLRESCVSMWLGTVIRTEWPDILEVDHFSWGWIGCCAHWAQLHLHLPDCFKPFTVASLIQGLQIILWRTGEGWHSPFASRAYSAELFPW